MVLWKRLVKECLPFSLESRAMRLWSACLRNGGEWHERVTLLAATLRKDQRCFSVPEGNELCQLLYGCYIRQLAVELAEQNGFVPGQFLFGQKITVANDKLK